MITPSAPGTEKFLLTRARGFTLVEVMVALAIVAIALPALLLALSQQADDTAYLRDKTAAQMVAANKLAELRLVIASTRSLQAGRSNGVDTMVGQDWHWWVETIPSPVEKFFRIKIKVALDPERQEQPLYTLTAFMSSDLQIDQEGLGGGGGDGDGDGGDGGDGGGGDGGDTGIDEGTGNDGGTLGAGTIRNSELSAEAAQRLIDQMQGGRGGNE